MGLPPEIPGELVGRSIEIPGLGGDEGAWSREDALAVIESLEGTTVVVEAVTVCELAPLVLLPPVPGWALARVRGESSADYARRSRTGAARFIEAYVEPASEVMIFVLQFSMQNAAA